MKKLIFIIFFLFSSFFILHSTAQVIFQKTFGGSGWDKANKINSTDDGGYIIIGSTSSFGTGNCYFIKIDDKGDTIQTKVLDISDGDDCKQTTEGGYIITGSTSDFGAGNSDVFLIKTDINANTLWTKSYGGTGNDFARSIQQMSDSGYVITGFSQSFGAGFNDVYLIRTDQNGDILWTRTYGGTDGDGSMSIQQTAGGGYIILGSTNTFGEGSSDFYLIRTNDNGDTLWTKTYGGGALDDGWSVQQTVDSGYVITGHTTSFGVGNPGSGFSDVYLIRTDANGDTLWTKTYGEAGSEIAYSIQQTNDGGYVIVGETTSFGADWWDAYMIRTDANGNLLWSRTYKFGDNIKNTFYDVKQTADGGFIAVGETGDFFTRDVYVVKTDADGNSGCNDSIVNMITGSTNTIVGTPATIVGSGAIVGNTATIVGSTATVDSVLCIDTLTGIGEQGKWLDENHILKNFPNPFSRYTTIEVYVPEEISSAEIVIYNLLGITIKRYSLDTGYNALTVLEDDLPGDGIYFYILKGNDQMLDKRKMLMLKH